MGDWFNQNAPKAAGDKPAGDWFAQNAPKAETPGALARFGHGLYDTTLGPIVQTVSHPIDAAAGLINVPKLEEIAKHIKDGNYGHAALAIGQYATEDPLKRAATQMVGDVVHDVKEGNLAGAGGRVVGDALMLAGPKVLDAAGGAVARVARVASDPAVVRAGVKVLPKGNAAVQFYDAVQEARAKNAPPPPPKPPLERTPIWQDNQPVTVEPEMTPQQWPTGALPSGRVPGTGRPAYRPPPAPLDRTPIWDQQPPIPNQPVSMTPQVEAPAVTPWEARRIARESALKAEADKIPPEVIAELTRDSELAVAGVKPNAVAPQEQIQAPEPAGPVIDPQASQFPANGDPKSAAFRGEEVKAQNTTAKAKRFAEQMHAKGVSSQDAADMQGGRVSDTQIQQGAPPRWGNLADYIGENEPKTSVPEIIAELRKLESVKPALPQEPPPTNGGVTAKSPLAMNRAELAKQAGLPENATKEQIMKALADAMEEPKAAAAGKGK